MNIALGWNYWIAFLCVGLADTFAWIKTLSISILKSLFFLCVTSRYFASFAFMLFLILGPLNRILCVQLCCFGRIADLGRNALTTASFVSIYGPPIRSMQ